MGIVTKPIILNETYIEQMQEHNQALMEIAAALDRQAVQDGQGGSGGSSGYVHPIHTPHSSGLYKVTVDGKGHVVAAAPVTKNDITALDIPGSDTTYGVATTSANGLMSKEDKRKLSDFNDASTYALKSEIANVYKYKGSKATAAELPVSGNTNGDTWNVEETGMNYAWNGTEWDALGEIINPATTDADGLMSMADKLKLNGIDDNANYFEHPTFTSYSSGLYKVEVDNEGHVIAATPATKNDITTLGIPDNSIATSTANGLMSYEDKLKLEGIADNATNYEPDNYGAHESGLYKITVDEHGHVSNAVAATSSDLPSHSHTISNVSTSADGLAPKVTNTDGFLKGDGTWATPTISNVPVVTTTSDGLMTSSDKTKLNKFSEPTLSAENAKKVLAIGNNGTATGWKTLQDIGVIVFNRIWVNSNPRAAMNTKEINVNSISNYNLFAIEFTPHKDTNTNSGGLHFFMVENNSAKTFCTPTVAWNENVAMRTVTINKGDHKILFSAASSNGASLVSGGSTDCCIPLRIYGVAGVVINT